MKPSIILINPWIYDFAAYDLWSKPLGLLSLAGRLRQCGFAVRLIDCLDAHHPSMASDPFRKPPVRRKFGTGKFWRTRVAPPERLLAAGRPYSRYGVSTAVYEEELRRAENPSAILITSLMTYWYPGVVKAVELARKVHTQTPIVLGGIYAQICHDHARRVSGADLVSTERDPQAVVRLLETVGVHAPDPQPPLQPPYPAFDLLNRIDYVCLLTSTGCPYGCRYCASRFLRPEFVRRDPQEVFEEIVYWRERFGVRDFAFYDDALLVNSENGLSPVLERLAALRAPVRFHTPNALHAREITPELARLMHLSGFETIRLGLETSDFSQGRDLDDKISAGEFERAVALLKKGGFSPHQVGAYVLAGLPGQSVRSVEETIRFVAETGASPYLSEYSPIPHTALWEKAVLHSSYPIAEDPLFQNNTLLPCWGEDARKELPRLKRLVLEARQKAP